LALVLAACGERPTISLRYHPPAGAVYRYALEQRTAMTMESGPLAAMGKQEMVMRMHFTQAVTGPAGVGGVGGVGGGGTTVRITFDSVGMEAPGVPPEVMARELGRLRGLQATVLFDERARVVRTDFAPAAGVPPEMTAQMAAGVKAMAFSFPEQPVGRGDSWTVSTDLPMGQLRRATAGAAGERATARTTLTVNAIEVARGDTSVLLDVTTEFPEEPLLVEVGGRQATMRIAGTLSGTQEFSVTRGAVVHGTMKGSMRLSITSAIVGAPTTTEMTSDAETTMRLLDGT
ncbi:MAG: hypothetical protein ACREME_00130, partial [Gemmatimonadales bacterium]